MEELRLVRAPPRVLRATYEAIGGAELLRGAHVGLVVRSRVEGARLRALGNYLLLVDRLYGRLGLVRK